MLSNLHLPPPLRYLLLLLALLPANLESTEVAAKNGAAGTPVYPVLCDPRTHGCLRHPPGCRSVHRKEPGHSCDYLAAWRRVGVPGGDSDGVEVAIAGRVGSTGGYVALGFRPDRGGSAAGDGVLLACYKSGSESRVHLRLVTYSRGPSGLRFLAGSPDILAEADGAPQFKEDRPEQAGYFWPVEILGFGALECRAKLRLGRGGPLERLLQLNSDPPDGPALRPVALRYDGDQPVLSPGGEGLEKPVWRHTGHARPLNEVGETGRRRSTSAAKAHCCLMILAWVLCASICTILARYYKHQWPARLLCSKLVWFQAHRILMGICCGLTLLAFIIIFVDVGGYSALEEPWDVAHPVLGIIVTILTLVNPLMSLCRCKPGSPNRPWFNWFHWGVCTVAYILAVVNLFLGLRLERAGALRSIDYHIWILILFVVIQFVVEIILEVHTLYHWKRNKRRWEQYDKDVQEFRMQVKQLQESGMQKPLSKPVEPIPVGYCIRTFLLALHATLAVAVALILFVVVIVY